MPAITEALSLSSLANLSLAAMVSHDPGNLPLAANVRYTENGQPLMIGDGLWRTLTRFAGDDGPDAPNSPGCYRLDLVDPETGTAIFFGAIVENSTPGMLMLRVALRSGLIAEIEAVAVRLEIVAERGGTVTMFQPRLLTPFDPAGFVEADAALTLPVEEARRSDPAELVAVVDRYLGGIERDSHDDIALGKAFIRRDNGLRTTDNPNAAPFNPDVPAYRPFALGLPAQIDSGFFRRVSRISGRRHLLADPARGLVMTVLLHDHLGRIGEIDVPGIGLVALPGSRPEQADQTPDELFGSRATPNLRVPTSELIVQLTRVEGGEISRIEAISRGGPLGLTSGW